MELQRKIKQDFEFYSAFTESVRRFSKQEDNYLSEAWIQKLLGEQYIGIGNQYNRNIFLANLILCIQKGKLTGPFTQYPPDYGLPNAVHIFGTSSTEIKDPTWLNSIVDNDIYCNVRAKDKRTYLATKAAPDGKGALGYIAVSLAEGEPQWIQKEGGFFENRDYHSKSDKDENHQHSFEKSNPKSEKPLRYYKYILNNINNELSGLKDNQECEGTEKLMKLLIENLRKKGLLQYYEHHSPETKRKIFLSVLQEKLKKRISKLTKQNMSNYNQVDPENDANDPTENRMQRYDIGDTIKKVEKFDSNMSLKHLSSKLKEIYPELIVDRFLYFLAKDKEQITKKIENHHNTKIAQLINNVRQEYTEKKRKCDDAQYALDEIKNILLRFKITAKEHELMKKENLRKHKKQKENYIKLKKTFSATNRLLMEEEKRKIWLTEMLKVVEEQTEKYKKCNEANLKCITNDNTVLMQNIDMLTKHLKRHENKMYKRAMVCNDSACKN